MLGIAHVTRIMDAPPDSEWAIAQPVTAESMRNARRFAEHVVSVSFFAAIFPEEAPVVPQDFQALPPLDRSVLDLRSFRVPRKLPLYRDILDRLYAASNAEIFIYTNTDIALMPHFYQAVSRYIDEGFDAFTINRRSIAGHYRSSAELPSMYGDIGEKHPGFDCFVFRRGLYPSFVIGDGCLGMGNGETALLSSMIATAKKFRDFREEHLTFHIGKGATWRRPQYADYLRFCNQESVKAIRSLLVRDSRTPGPIFNLMLQTGIIRHRLLVPALKRLYRHA